LKTIVQDSSEARDHELDMEITCSNARAVCHFSSNQDTSVIGELENLVEKPQSAYIKHQHNLPFPSLQMSPVPIDGKILNVKKSDYPPWKVKTGS
jgi:hypothetical protein